MSARKISAVGAALIGLIGVTLAPPIVAQEADASLQPLGVGEPAPDFELTGSTRFGVLETPVRLSDFRGKTVVLAFFFRVRTKG